MKWTVQALQQARYESLHFDENVLLEDQLKEHQDVRAASLVSLKGTATANRNVFTFQFVVKGHLVLPCSRTLADVEWPYEIKGQAHYVPEGEMPPSHLNEEDVFTYSGDVIDLSHMIQERILVEIPMQVFADKPTETAAPSSGKDWELVSDEKNSDQIDPRLADLAKFFDEK
ncbi:MULTISPECIES: YceD family protein [Bacillaceae]|uniref:DUF177 domain-containing protein n=1 Tax=Alkalicoccobacillus plakortidis TaxID=444060 RepID=A0A9D5DQ74_9BACI|nr:MULTISPECIES: YceD family protein [Bacillaceae]KQL58143.1 hypothetical protein AN965_05045 [Alkalicoccobacillus plakortidis]